MHKVWIWMKDEHKTNDVIVYFLQEFGTIVLTKLKYAAHWNHLKMSCLVFIWIWGKRSIISLCFHSDFVFKPDVKDVVVFLMSRMVSGTGVM